MGVLDLILCYDQMVKEEPSDDDNYTDDDNDDGDAEMQKAIWIAQMQIWPAKNYHQMCFRQTAQLVSHFPFLLWQERHNLVTDITSAQC